MDASPAIMTNLSTWEFQAGTLAHCDCVDWLPKIQPESIQLIAVDPPFFTGKLRVGAGESPAAYPDSWRGSKTKYVDWLLERIRLMIPLLELDGSLLVHLDWHAVHAVKVALDDLMGEDHFQNEIVWRYQTGGASKKRFSRKHDTLLWYTRSDAWKFYPERIPIPRTEKALERARNPKGARIASEDTHKYPEDVISIPQLNPMSNERTGYPTQKPVELMELFVKALTDPGDGVADFFCGSGTTPVAAARLGRRWLACDSSKEAVEIARKRLHSLDRNGN